MLRKPAENVGPSHGFALYKIVPGRGENRPENFALPAADPRLAAETAHIAILLPGLYLPGVDDFAPFAPEEIWPEAVSLDLGRLAQGRANQALRRNVRLAEKLGVEVVPDPGERLDGQSRLRIRVA